MSNNTALTELIERLITLNNKHDDAGLRAAIDIANQLITKEKNDIIDANYRGTALFYCRKTSVSFRIRTIF